MSQQGWLAWRGARASRGDVAKSSSSPSPSVVADLAARVGARAPPMRESSSAMAVVLATIGEAGSRGPRRRPPSSRRRPRLVLIVATERDVLLDVAARVLAVARAISGTKTAFARPWRGTPSRPIAAERGSGRDRGAGTWRRVDGPCAPPGRSFRARRSMSRFADVCSAMAVVRDRCVRQTARPTTEVAAAVWKNGSLLGVVDREARRARAPPRGSRVGRVDVLWLADEYRRGGRARARRQCGLEVDSARGGATVFVNVLAARAVPSLARAGCRAEARGDAGDA